MAKKRALESPDESVTRKQPNQERRALESPDESVTRKRHAKPGKYG